MPLARIEGVLRWAPVLVFVLCLSLVSCSVGSIGPGASQTSLAKKGMSDYYYKKSAGWTYVYSNIENVYDTDGTVARTLIGASDTVRTLGYYCLAPNGDSLYRYAITYRVSARYAGRGPVDLWYVSQASTKTGGFVENADQGIQVKGMLFLLPSPRAVSSDTILFGVVGVVRTMSDDLSSAATGVWQTDTIWASAHQDTVLIWERFPGSTTLSASRCIFTGGVTNYTTWNTDLLWGQTSARIINANTTVTVPCGTYNTTAELNVYNNKTTLPITETQWFSFGVGVTKEFDSWYATTDGIHFFKRDFTRSLVSLTHD